MGQFQGRRKGGGGGGGVRRPALIGGHFFTLNSYINCWGRDKDILKDFVPNPLENVLLAPLSL